VLKDDEAILFEVASAGTDSGTAWFAVDRESFKLGTIVTEGQLGPEFVIRSREVNISITPDDPTELTAQ
jgi:hypothetical protein